MQNDPSLEISSGILFKAIQYDRSMDKLQTVPYMVVT